MAGERGMGMCEWLACWGFLLVGLSAVVVLLIIDVHVATESGWSEMPRRLIDVELDKVEHLDTGVLRVAYKLRAEGCGRASGVLEVDGGEPSEYWFGVQNCKLVASPMRPTFYGWRRADLLWLLGAALVAWVVWAGVGLGCVLAGYRAESKPPRCDVEASAELFV